MRRIKGIGRERERKRDCESQIIIKIKEERIIDIIKKRSVNIIILRYWSTTTTNLSLS